ncbi:MAG: heme o synthase, partial [Rhodothermales bacterium]
MNLSRTRSIATPAAPATWKDWLTLTKPEITFLVTISSLAGFVMASTGGVDGWTLFWAMIGIPLTSAGGCALNQVLEVELDARMKRTANRPLPSGRIDVSHATWFAVGLIAAGVGILCPLTNPLTGVMAAVTVALYIWVYTPLKRKSTWNTLVGTIPGALPILGGWTAASGDVGAGGWALFGVLLCWQMPHFFALAWMYRKDYGESPFLMLPSGD